MRGNRPESEKAMAFENIFSGVTIRIIYVLKLMKVTVTVADST